MQFKYDNPIKSAARRMLIDAYRRITNRQTLPTNKTYWTLCNDQTYPNSEINILSSDGFIRESQFVGVDRELEYILANKEKFNKSIWLHEEWDTAIDNPIFASAGMVYFDSLNFAENKKALDTITETMMRCPEDCVMGINLLLNDSRSRKRFSEQVALQSIRNKLPSRVWRRFDQYFPFSYCASKKSQLITIMLYRA